MDSGEKKDSQQEPKIRSTFVLSLKLDSFASLQSYNDLQVF